jgi:hypothetical protein
MTKKPISDRAEVAVDFAGKIYMGSFTTHSRFDAEADDRGVHIHLEHQIGEYRRVGIHFHYRLFADILSEIAGSISSQELLADWDRDRLAEAVAKLGGALEDKP